MSNTVGGCHPCSAQSSVHRLHHFATVWIGLGFYIYICTVYTHRICACVLDYLIVWQRILLSFYGNLNLWFHFSKFKELMRRKLKDYQFLATLPSFCLPLSRSKLSLYWLGMKSMGQAWGTTLENCRHLKPPALTYGTVLICWWRLFITSTRSPTRSCNIHKWPLLATHWTSSNRRSLFDYK